MTLTVTLQTLIWIDHLVDYSFAVDVIAFQTQQKVQRLQQQHGVLSGGDHAAIVTQVNGSSGAADIEKFSPKATVSPHAKDPTPVTALVYWTQCTSLS